VIHAVLRAGREDHLIVLILTDGLPGAESSDPEFIQIDTARMTGSDFRTLTWSIAISPKQDLKVPVF
jgi:hypothetical protein